MISNKIERVQPNQPEVSPYVRGTEAGHFYLVTNDTELGVVGFRPLNVDFVQPSANPEEGVSTRIRFIPVQDKVESLRCLLVGLGFVERKYEGETETHFSKVTTDPEAVIESLAGLRQIFDLNAAA